MAQNVVINNVTYNDCPEVNIPLASGGGSARYLDTSDATLDASGKMLAGVTAYAGGVKYTGNIQSVEAATITPGTADQTIAAGQYLAGAQTILGDVNLTSANIKTGVTVFGVTGSLAVPQVSQDSSSHILTIS